AALGQRRSSALVQSPGGLVRCRPLAPESFSPRAGALDRGRRHDVQPAPRLSLSRSSYRRALWFFRIRRRPWVDDRARAAARDRWLRVSRAIRAPAAGLTVTILCRFCLTRSEQHAPAPWWINSWRPHSRP